MDVLICTAKEQDDWRDALAACLPEAHIGIHLHEDGTGHLDQVRGFANRDVEPALVEFGKRLARMRHADAVEDGCLDVALQHGP